MRPLPKRAFAFRYIELLGHEIMVIWWTSLLKMFACPTEKIGCPGPSERQIVKACSGIWRCPDLNVLSVLLILKLLFTIKGPSVFLWFLIQHVAVDTFEKVTRLKKRNPKMQFF